jgi:hypothetical protein
MIGEIIEIDGKPEIIIAEDIVTTYPDETDAQYKARTELRLPMPSYKYTSAKARPLTPSELKKWQAGLLG